MFCSWRVLRNHYLCVVGNQSFLQALLFEVNISSTAVQFPVHLFTLVDVAVTGISKFEMHYPRCFVQIRVG